MNLTRVWAVTYKEWREVLRDRLFYHGFRAASGYISGADGDFFDVKNSVRSARSG
jgi:hypothetical protein